MAGIIFGAHLLSTCLRTLKFFKTNLSWIKYKIKSLNKRREDRESIKDEEWTNNHL